MATVEVTRALHVESPATAARSGAPVMTTLTLAKGSAVWPEPVSVPGVIHAKAPMQEKMTS